MQESQMQVDGGGGDEVVYQVNETGMEEFNKQLAFFIQHKRGVKTMKRSSRSRPTFTETQDAVQALLEQEPQLDVLNDHVTAPVPSVDSGAESGPSSASPNSIL